jgi:signal peptide peptidase SppA
MTTQINLEPIRNEPLHLDQYFGLWAVEETRFMQMFDRVSKIDLGQHVRLQLQVESENSDPKQSKAAYEAGMLSATGVRKPAAAEEKNVAVIDVSGTLMKRGSSLSASSSLIRLRQSIRSAANDETVGAILLRIDSPGGTTAGTADLAKEVSAAAQKKPCVAFVEDLCASAAYWVGSQCQKIFANDATAMIGSIGTFIGLYDYSANAAMNGVKAVVIKTGSHKAAGFAGTEITAEQQAHFQSLVDSTQVEFTAAVASGRNIPLAKAEELADGRVHLAGDALKMGLIDGIQSFDATLAQLQVQAASSSSSRTNNQNSSLRSNAVMSEQITTSTQAASNVPAAATIAELESGCPGASADFLCKQLKKSATLAQAQQEFMSEQNARLQATEKELAEAKAKAAEKKPALGVDALGSGTQIATEVTGDPIAEWNEKLQATMSARKCDRQTACGIIGRQNPELRQAFVAAYNAAHPRHEEK